jgi:predicted nucleic acid-binding protein
LVQGKCREHTHAPRLLQSQTLELAETDGKFPSLAFDSMTGKMGMRPVQMLYLEPRYINEALTLFRNRPDKGWSVTDCTSFVAMQLKGLDTAFALDEHFRQAGFQVVP